MEEEEDEEGEGGAVIKILFSVTTPFHASFFWCHTWDGCGMDAAGCSRPAQVETRLIGSSLVEEQFPGFFFFFQHCALTLC